MMNGPKASSEKPHSLKRLLKGAVLKRLLAEAHAVVGDAMQIGVCAGETVLPGASDAFGEQCTLPGDVSFPLRNRGEICGALVLRPSSPSDAKETGIDPQTAGRMITTFLQEIIDREDARRAVAGETLEQYRESAHLRKTTLLFNQSLRLDDVSQALLQQCRQWAELGMVFTTDQSGEAWRQLSSFGPVTEIGLEAITTSRLFHDIAAGDKGEIINNPASDCRWSNEVPGIQALICTPLKSPGHWSGVLVLVSCQQGRTFQAADLKLVSTLGQVAATAMANAHHFEEVQAMLNALLQALAAAIDSRDPCTSGHSQRVALFALALAGLMNDQRAEDRPARFSGEELQELYYAAMLHDVGKIGVKEAVLTKSKRLSAERLEAVAHRLAHWCALSNRDWAPMYEKIQTINNANMISEQDIALIKELAEQKIVMGETAFPLLHDEEQQQLLIPRGNLTNDEWTEIKNHPSESYRILQHIPFPRNLQQVLTIIIQHHEKLDGTGYPNGSKAEEILLQSRILAIVDIYDALTAADRPYKKALPREKALTILRKEASAGKLDTDLTDFFCANINHIEERLQKHNGKMFMTK